MATTHRGRTELVSPWLFFDLLLIARKLNNLRQRFHGVVEFKEIGHPPLEKVIGVGGGSFDAVLKTKE